MIRIRQAEPADLDLVGDLIRKLADYEKLAHEVRFDRETLAQHLFGDRPRAEVLIALTEIELARGAVGSDSTLQ